MHVKDICHWCQQSNGQKNGTFGTRDKEVFKGTGKADLTWCSPKTEKGPWEELSLDPEIMSPVWDKFRDKLEKYY